MQIQERYLWIAGIILAGFVIQGQSKKNDDFKTLMTSYQLEAEIQSSQIMDFSQEVSSIKSNEYQKGFEDGRAQAGIAFVNGRPMLEYADGYHAALEQFSESYIREDEKLIRELAAELDADIEAMAKGE
tara:strand:+ start:292 stop:678 length:387 start_codon:yes stop_codon:yes gene_type:complete